MITGYAVGTRVKWNEQNTFTTGVIEQVFRETQEVDLNGESVLVKVGDDSPSYLIRDHTNRYLILPHADVILKASNVHT